MENGSRKLITFKKNQLFIDKYNFSEIVKENKTPFYLYSERILTNNFNLFKKAIKKSKQKGLICFALKSNNNIEVLKTLARLGSGADIVSGGELKQALKAGIPASKIVFSGVGKTEKEIKEGLKANILSFNVESLEELEMINSLAKKMKVKAQVAFRLNPKVHAKTHKHISTGYKTHKFGILKDDILMAAKVERYWTNTQLVGLSIHIGSQLTNLDATFEAIENMCDCANELGINLKFLDVGGGLGVNYKEGEAPEVDAYIAGVDRIIKSKCGDIKVVYEPGRSISATCGFFVSKVIRSKVSEDCRFVIVDGGMNDFVRPSLYDAYHEIFSSVNSKDLVETDIVGPICETADCFGTSRMLPKLTDKDFVIIGDTGAYGHTMSSHYNMRKKPKEIFLTK
jgi:diaminopimelate decarboxylase